MGKYAVSAAFVFIVTFIGHSAWGATSFTSVNPTSGSTAGGTTVTLGGSGFNSSTRVWVGGTLAPRIVIVSANYLYIETPIRTAGPVSMTIQSTTGTAIKNSAYTYVNSNPIFSDLSVNSGPIAGGTQTTIQGSGFKNGIKVYFGGTLSPNVDFIGANWLRVQTPPHPAGLVSLRLTNTDGTTSTFASAFRYVAPSPTPTPTPTPKPTPTPAPPPPTPTPSGAKLIFKTGFEDSQLGPIYNCNGNGIACYQDIEGRDPVTGFSWPIPIWGNVDSRFILIGGVPVSPTTIANYAVSKLLQAAGPKGNTSTVLYQSVVKLPDIVQPPTQDAYYIKPDLNVAQGDLYVRYWIKLQPNLAEINRDGWGRMFFQWKTESDYRISLYIRNNSANIPYWSLEADNSPSGLRPITKYWRADNATAVVPAGRWMKFEYFQHRSAGGSGRAWVAIDGKMIIDHRGPNMGPLNQRINRFMLFTLYHGGYPGAYQWVDDVEVWNGFPANAAPH